MEAYGEVGQEYPDIKQVTIAGFCRCKPLLMKGADDDEHAHTAPMRKKVTYITITAEYNVHL